MNLSKWLLDYDEKFWSIVKDEHKRKDYLGQLYRQRISRVLFMCVYAVMSFVGVAVDKAWFLGLGLILFVVQGIVYLDTDSKIRTFRLYELLAKK